MSDSTQPYGSVLRHPLDTVLTRMMEGVDHFAVIDLASEGFRVTIVILGAHFTATAMTPREAVRDVFSQAEKSTRVSHQVLANTIKWIGEL